MHTAVQKDHSKRDEDVTYKAEAYRTRIYFTVVIHREGRNAKP